MSDKDEIDRLVNALKKVPEKRLLLIELANSIPIKGGILDPVVLADKQREINLALAEAKAYGTATIQAVFALSALKPRKEANDVGPGLDNPPE